MLATGFGGLFKPIIHFWSVLSRSSSLNLFSHNTFECADTHASLSVSCQCIVPSEGVAAKTSIGFGTGMNLGMSFQVVSSNEAFVAVIAFELSVTKVGLNMGFDVLFSAEPFVAVLELAYPLLVFWVRPFNVLCNIIESDVCLFNRGFDAWVEVEV